MKMDHASKTTAVKNALAVALYERNIDAWRSPDRGSGSPTLLSRRYNLQSMVGDGGTLWIILSRPAAGKSRLYSLTYKLVACQRFTARGTAARRFGKHGVRGNPVSSSFYPTNDARLVLMSLRFPGGRPVPSLGRINQHLRFPRYLSDEDVCLLEEYAERHIDRRSVFVSYAHADARYAIDLKDALERHGISVFRDEESILSGQNWRQGIAHAIEHAMYFVVLCSPISARSVEVRNEIEQAMKRRSIAEGSGYTIVPIFLTGSSLDDKAWLELTEFEARRWVEDDPEPLFEKLAADFKHLR